MPPWTDRAGHFAALKCAAFIGVLLPAGWIAIEAAEGWLGSRPTTEAIHQSGLWAIRFLAMTLAVTPLRTASRWSKLISIRRILGVSVLAYAALHFGLYVFDQHFDLWRVGSEISARIYLTIGFVSFCGLCALGATSTDAMIARLGALRWGKLHRLVYPIAILGSIHFFMQSKLDVSEPIAMAGIFSLLLAFRAAQRRLGDLSAWAITVLTLVVGFATALGEALWYGFSIHAPVLMLLKANLDFSYAIRPCWFVVGVGALLALARILRKTDWKTRRSSPAGTRGRAAALGRVRSSAPQGLS